MIARRLLPSRAAPMLLFFGLLLSACARFGAVPVPSLATLPPSAATIQSLVFEHDGQQQQMLAVLQHDQQQLRMAFLSPQGQRLLTLEQDGNNARFLPGAVFKPPFSAQWLLQRLSWSLWPMEQLQQAFTGTAWSTRATDRGHDIYHRKQLVARITEQDHCHMVDDRQAGYRLFRSSIDTHRTQDLPPCPAN